MKCCLFAILFTAVLATTIPEEPVRIAYYITVTPENEALLPRFLMRIYHEDNLYLVDYAHPLIPRSSFTRPNIHHRQADRYTPNGISEVINVLDGMAYFLNRESYNEERRSFEYFIHCSPTEYPLINPTLMRQVLSFDERDYPPPNYFAFKDEATYSDEVDRLYMDLALTFNNSLDLSNGLLPTRLAHPDKSRRSMHLPRSDKHFVVNHEVVKLAVDSVLSKRLLLVLADTSHVYQRFFAALAYNSKDPVGTLVKTTSLRCLDEASEQLQAFKLSNYKVQPPTIDMLKNSSVPCLFTGPFYHAHRLFDEIDNEFLIPPGKQGKDPGPGFHDRVKKMLRKLHP